MQVFIKVLILFGAIGALYFQYKVDQNNNKRW